MTSYPLQCSFKLGKVKLKHALTLNPFFKYKTFECSKKRLLLISVFIIQFLCWNKKAVSNSCDKSPLAMIRLQANWFILSHIYVKTKKKQLDSFFCFNSENVAPLYIYTTIYKNLFFSRTLLSPIKNCSDKFCSLIQGGGFSSSNDFFSISLRCWLV